jgi:hypothetical protein
MIKIKLTIDYPREWIMRQTPNNDGIWGKYKFYINEEIEECDYWVVYGKGIKKKEKCIVPENHTILIYGEPPSIYQYSDKYIKKYSLVASCDENIVGNNIVHNQPSIPWWVGIKNSNIDRVTDKNKVKIDEGYSEEKLIIEKSYKDFKDSSIFCEKNKLISVVVSNKVMTKGHIDRLNFIKSIKKYFGEIVDLYGRGICDVSDKTYAIKDYKYHIVLENYSSRYYWTEKLSDAYLENAYPIYYGCTNIYDYFSRNSLSEINIYNIDEAIKTIKHVLDKDYYAERYNEILKSKALVIDKYNIFSEIIGYCELCDPSSYRKKIEMNTDMENIDYKKILLYLSRLSNKAYYRLSNIFFKNSVF